MSGIYQNWEPAVIHSKKYFASKQTTNNSPKPKVNYNNGDEEMPKRIEYTPELINALQSARAANNLSQAELAQKLNIPAKIINDIESRKSAYNKTLYTNIMKKLNVDIKSLKDILI
jgi:ribosome-binding protein aMBF1 (putative translation factor)